MRDLLDIAWNGSSKSSSETASLSAESGSPIDSRTASRAFMSETRGMGIFGAVSELGSCGTCIEALARLDLQLGASSAEVEKARLTMLRVWHPDRFALQNDLLPLAEQKTQRINGSYEHLISHRECWCDSGAREPLNPDVIAVEPNTSFTDAPPRHARSQADKSPRDDWFESWATDWGRSGADETEESTETQTVWRLAKVFLRSTWRFFKIVVAIVLSVLLLLLALAGILAVLSDHWRDKKNAEHDALAAFREFRTVMLVADFCGTSLLVARGIISFGSLLLLAMIFLGSQLWVLSSTNPRKSTAVMVAISSALFAWIFLKERRVEFAQREAGAPPPTTISWVMGLLVLLLTPFVISYADHAWSEPQTSSPASNTTQGAVPLLDHDSAPSVSAEPVPVPSEPAQVRIESFGGDFDVAAALQLVFKNSGGSVDHTDSGQPIIRVPESELVPEMVVTPILDEEFAGDVGDPHLVVTSSAPSDRSLHCHACEPTIGAYLFGRIGAGWVVESADKEVTNFGAFDEPPTARAVKLGNRIDGFSLEMQHLGYGLQDTEDIFLAPIRGKYKIVFSALVVDSNGDICEVVPSQPCYRNTTTLSFVDAGGEFYDIAARRIGSQASKDGTIPSEDAKVYTFSGERYVVATTANQNEPRPPADIRQVATQ